MFEENKNNKNIIKICKKYPHIKILYTNNNSISINNNIIKKFMKTYIKN